MSFPFEDPACTWDDDASGAGDPLSRTLDRLVDGELGEAERADLLGRLDRTPDGWRRCALAFLEARAWGEALAPVARRPAVESPRIVPVASPRRSTTRGWAAIAAGLIASFGLGWAANGRTGATREPNVAVLKPQPQVIPITERRPAVSELRDERFIADIERLAVQQRPPLSEPAVAPRAVPPAPDLPEALVKQWAVKGYEVDQRRRVVPVRLEDGRRVPMPVDEVRVRYVGDQVY